MFSPLLPVRSSFNLPLCLFQFLYKGTQARDDIATEAYEEELDMGRSGSYLNSSITSAWSEHSLDPEDIRVKNTKSSLSSTALVKIFSCYDIIVSIKRVTQLGFLFCIINL